MGELTPGAQMGATGARDHDIRWNFNIQNFKGVPTLYEKSCPKRLRIKKVIQLFKSGLLGAPPCILENFEMYFIKF